MDEINIRYLKDTDGETYFPMTHVNAILGIDEFDDSGDIKDLETLINAMRITISSLQTSNKTLTDSLIIANQKIAQNELDIKMIKTFINMTEEAE